MMKKTLLGFALVLGFSTFAQADEPNVDMLTATCVACHGADGNSMEFTPTWPKLSGQGANYLYKQIIDIRDGKRPIPEMTGMVDHFTDADARAVAQHYADIETSEGTGSANELGETLYKVGSLARGITACTACHQPQGEGNQPAAFPQVAGQQVAYLVNQLTTFRDASRTNDPNKMMQLIAEKLTDEDIDALANYMSSLKP